LQSRDPDPVITAAFDVVENLSLPTARQILFQYRYIGGAENAGAENAGPENSGSNVMT